MALPRPSTAASYSSTSVSGVLETYVVTPSSE